MTAEAGPDFETLADAYVARIRSGEDVDSEQVAQDHPEHATKIRELFPVLAMMEGLKPATSSRDSGAGAGTTPDLLASLPPTIGPYVIRAEIGRGGMGRVLEATTASGERVAVKLVHPHLVSRSGYLARFLREVEVGRRLQHTGLVRTLGSGLHEEEGREIPYLVLEYVEGQNLRDLLEETGTVSERLAREVATQVADALAAVHAEGVVHRDVKPENVVIAPDESVKLMDLGVALLAEENMRLTQTGEFVGSLLYAAPEQLRGDALDGRADLYALGLLLYELVAGHHPDTNPGASPRRRLPRAHARRPLAEAAPEVSPFFDHVVRTLLSVDPAKRFEDAATLASTLRLGEQSAWWRTQEARGTSIRLASVDTPLYGRDQDIDLLLDIYVRVRESEGRVLLLEGEAGIGKSRLLAEWLRGLRADTEDGPRSLVVQHEPGSGAVASSPFATALAEALRGPERRARLEHYLGPRAGLLDAMERHLDDEEAEGEGATLSPAARGSAYLDLLRGMAAERKLIIVLEDLHFGSDEARALYLLLARGLRQDAVLVVATARLGVEGLWPEDLRDSPRATRHALQGLGLEAAHALMRDSMGNESTLGSGMRDFVHHADGNPFCLLEFAREMRDRRDRHTEEVSIPSSLRELVEGRLHALNREDLDLLSVAACAVDPFDPVLICDALGMPHIAGLRHFHELHRDRGLLRADGPTYRFQHHLVREVLHDELPPALKAAYHAALGAALEARIPEAEREGLIGLQAYALVRHFLLGDQPLRAVPYAREAVEHLHAEREWPRGVELAERILALGDAVPEMDRAWILVGRGMSLLSYAPTDEAAAALEEAYTYCRAFDGEEIAVHAATGLAVCYRHAGQNERALGVHMEGMEAARKLGKHQAHARALGFTAASLAENGRLDEARELAEEGLALAKAMGRPITAAEIARHLGAIEIDQGNLTRARQLLEHTLSVGEFYGEVTHIQNSLQLLGKLAYLEGNLAETLDMTQRLVRHNQVEGHARMEAIGRVNLAAIHGKLGELDKEAEEATACLLIAERMGYKDVAAHAHTSLGKLAEQHGDLVEAEQHYRAGYEGAIALGQPVFVARMGIPLARLCAMTGRLDDARDLVETARTSVEAIGAVRELAHVRNVEAEIEEWKGDDRAAAALWGESAAALETASMAHESAWCRLREGLALARLAEVDAARDRLEAARRVLAELGLSGFAAEADTWLGALPGGDALVARQALEKHKAMMGVVPWALAGHALGQAEDDPRLLRAARERIEALIAGTAEEHRNTMRALPPFARVLDA